MSVDEALASVGGTVAIFALPAYIGVADHTFGAFLLYALWGGLGLGLADWLIEVRCPFGWPWELVHHTFDRYVCILLIGGPIYGFAIMTM